MDVRTCSYAEIKPDMGLAVQISLGTPKWWKSPPRASIWAITPRNSYMRFNDDGYIAEYRKQLRRYGVDAIRAEFENCTGMADGGTIVLLCFENLSKPSARNVGGGWCHRSLFAAWWREETGEVIPEMGKVIRGARFVPDDAPNVVGSEPDRLTLF